MKLGLGTVQFGCNYGISNQNGQVERDEVKSILTFAKQNNIDVLDTASLYGNSESILGTLGVSDFNVITKTIKISANLSRAENIKAFEDALFNSRKNLGNINLYGIMFHEANDLLSSLGSELWNSILNFQKDGFVKQIGVSVYTPVQLTRIIDKFDIQLVQFPLNILDQRFLGLLDVLKKRNIEIHTRSTFLQGLLLMDINKIDNYFNEIKPTLNKIPEPKLAYALDFVKSLYQIDRIIVGCTSKKELNEIVDMYKISVDKINYEALKITDEKFILPQNWNK